MHHFGRFEDRALARTRCSRGTARAIAALRWSITPTGSVHTGLSWTSWRRRDDSPARPLVRRRLLHPQRRGGGHDQRTSYLLRPGDYAAVKVGTPHAWRAAGTSPVRWLQMAAPQPKPHGAERDTFFLEGPRRVPSRRRRWISTNLDGNLLGHFDASQIPPPSERKAIVLQGLEGVFLKWLIDENFGAAHHRLLFIEYQPGVGIGLHDHTFEEAYFILSGEVEAHDGRQDVPRHARRRAVDGRGLRPRLRQRQHRAGALARDVLRRSRRRKTSFRFMAEWEHEGQGAGGIAIMSAQTTGRTRPFTGAEYLESLRDGREIWIYGERVKDVTTHPAFRNTARMIARLYDALHDPGAQGRPDHARPTPAAAASRTSSTRRPQTPRSWSAARDAIAEWARVTLRLDRPQPRLQGRVPGHARRQRRLLRAVRRERAALVQEGPGGGVLRQPRHRQSAGRSRQAARRGEGRVHARRGGDRRRPDRQRREGRGDDLEPDALQLHRQQRRAADQDQAVRVRLHRADRRARA